LFELEFGLPHRTPELNDAVATYSTVNDSFSVSQSKFMEPSNSLLNYVNEDLLYMNVDGKDTGRVCSDVFSSILLNSHENVHKDDSPRLVEPTELTTSRAYLQAVDNGCSREEGANQPFDFGVDGQPHVYASEVGISSIPTPKFCLPEILVIMNCVSNTGNPEIS
jgi:hypothetical protein